MKKTHLIVLIALVAVLASALIIIICSSASEHIHSYGEWTVSKNATCTANGIKERDCSCGDIQTMDIPATGHYFSSWATTKEATCTVAGSKERTCSCGAVDTSVISATGHSFSSWAFTKSATCTTSGSKERTCSCGTVDTSVIPATGHKFSAWTTTKQATCTSDGSLERKCACGEVETKTITAGHSWASATCVTPKTCSVCNLTEGFALGHTTQSGKCGRCGNNITSTVKCTNSLPQTFTNWLGSKAGSTAQILDVRFERNWDETIYIYIDCKFIEEYITDRILISYYIKDPNGNIVDSGFIWEVNCIENLLFTKRIKLTPTTPGEYTITFYDYTT